ncbi:hypothetical protein [Streptomyces sp. NPDC017448]|uniref:hypothetical protein n=1 Tax=Streptomyces sp. NPDC017448 TaxID=3364996 RepID=UPI0037BD5924
MQKMNMPDKGKSRVTVFPLGDVSLAYTSWSSDSRGIGDVGIVALLLVEEEEEEQPEGQVWKVIERLWGRRAPEREVAEWLLMQALRCRVVHSARYRDLPDAEWTAELSRQVHLGRVFTNHEVLATGSLRLVGVSSSR